MRNTIYRQIVFCIDAYRTWIEVADANLYKEHVISRSGRTDHLVSRTLVLRTYKAHGAYDKGTAWTIPEHELDKALAAYRKQNGTFKSRIKKGRTISRQKMPRTLSVWRPTALSGWNSWYVPFTYLQNPITYDLDYTAIYFPCLAFRLADGIVQE